MTKSFKEQMLESYSTNLGTMWHGTIESALIQEPLAALKGKVDLVFTSPPYPLKKKKKYGNKTGDDYLQWLMVRCLRLVRDTILTLVIGSSLKMISLKIIKVDKS